MIIVDEVIVVARSSCGVGVQCRFVQMLGVEWEGANGWGGGFWHDFPLDLKIISIFLRF